MIRLGLGRGPLDFGCFCIYKSFCFLEQFSGMINVGRIGKGGWEGKKESEGDDCVGEREVCFGEGW